MKHPEELVLKCMVIGDGAVGKTSLIIKHSTGEFPTFFPSCTPISYSVQTRLSSLTSPTPLEKREYVPYVYDGVYIPTPHTPHTANDITVGMGIWDTGGGEDYDRLRPLSYPMTDVFIICFSVAVPASFQRVRTKYAPEVALHNPNTPILVVGTKTDLRDDFLSESPSSVPANRPIYHHEGLALVSQLEIDHGSYMECSSLTGSGVTAVFEQAMRLALEFPRERGKDRRRGLKTCIIL